MTNRRFFLKAAGAVAGAPMLGLPAMAAEKAHPLVAMNTASGRVLGHELPGALRFLGIPFAEPPVGARRFLAPEPIAPWQGLKPALSYATSAIQRPIGPSPYVPHSPTYSEDCLYLNVWTPKSAGPHPVYVWVYGGGNVAGTTSMPVFDGECMAARGVVVVSIAYRVGTLGFMDVSGLLGDRYAGSGNNGLRDLTLGLRWVRENIARFGGDPKRVTIGGQSAGGKNVISLMAAPEANGLFHGAISKSGGGQTCFDLPTARAIADQILAGVGLSRQNARGLIDVPADELLKAQVKLIAGYPYKYPFRAVVDGVVLPKVPLDAIAAGASRDVPLLLGWTRDESAFFGPAKTPDLSVTQNELANMPLADFKAVQARYREAFPQWDAVQTRYRSISAEEYGVPSIRVAEALARAKGTAFLYRYDMPRTDGAKAGYAIHGSELALVFDNLHDSTAPALGPTGPKAAQLGAVMSQAWIDFIARGKPQASWGAYDLASRPTMRFDERSEVVADLDGKERLLWKDWAPVV